MVMLVPNIVRDRDQEEMLVDQKVKEGLHLIMNRGMILMMVL